MTYGQPLMVNKFQSITSMTWKERWWTTFERTKLFLIPGTSTQAGEPMVVLWHSEEVMVAFRTLLLCFFFPILKLAVVWDVLAGILSPNVMRGCMIRWRINGRWGQRFQENMKCFGCIMRIGCPMGAVTTMRLVFLGGGSSVARQKNDPR